MFPLLSVVFLMVSVAQLRADVIPWNSDPSSLQITDSGKYSDPHSLAGLFTNYFADELGSLGLSGYTSSQDLYEDRGVKSIVQNWTVNDNASIHASFKNAAFAHDLNLLNSSGNVVDTKSFPGYTFNDKLGDGLIFELSAGDYNFSLDVTSGIQNMFYGDDPTKNTDGSIHMVAFDVTDLMQARYGADLVESAYLFGWEDMLENNGGDWDYQDLAYIMVNVTPNLTPEPGTLLIFGVGIVFGAAAIRRQNRRKKEAVQA